MKRFNNILSDDMHLLRKRPYPAWIKPPSCITPVTLQD
ncbi:Universal stress protein family 1 [hydrothermal vent metagenome]|uniref:Universal stress protein family 1 n=1 Tax=hydrothermal vent metagenome TaxID=652676 RepID=A0A3B1AU81_9ZZZZ